MIQIYLEKTNRQIKGVISDMNLAVRPDFISKLADGLAFGTPTIIRIRGDAYLLTNTVTTRKCVCKTLCPYRMSDSKGEWSSLKNIEILMETIQKFISQSTYHLQSADKNSSP